MNISIELLTQLRDALVKGGAFISDEPVTVDSLDASTDIYNALASLDAVLNQPAETDPKFVLFCTEEQSNPEIFTNLKDMDIVFASMDYTMEERNEAWVDDPPVRYIDSVPSKYFRGNVGFETIPESNLKELEDLGI